MAEVICEGCCDRADIVYCVSCYNKLENQIKDQDSKIETLTNDKESLEKEKERLESKNAELETRIAELHKHIPAF